MIEFEVKSVEAKFGDKKGQVVYYAAPKTNRRVSEKQVEDYIVNATSLTRGDMRNALTMLAEYVNSELAAGSAIELADLGMIKVVVNSKQVATPEEVNATILKQPQIRFFPKQPMREAANKVRVKVINQYTKKETETPTPEA